MNTRTTRLRFGVPQVARPLVFGLVLAGLASSGGCATAPKREAEAAPPRIADSAPEKIAAQRAAARGLYLEENDQRWGFEEARARREAADRRKKAAQGPGTAPTGPVDLEKQRGER
jgi:hypothetical protein